LTGAQGIAGPTGAQGGVGAQGAQGIAGPTGAQGVPGPAVNWLHTDIDDTIALIAIASNALDDSAYVMVMRDLRSNTSSFGLNVNVTRHTIIWIIGTPFTQWVDNGLFTAIDGVTGPTGATGAVGPAVQPLGTGDSPTFTGETITGTATINTLVVTTTITDNGFSGTPALLLSSSGKLIKEGAVIITSQGVTSSVSGTVSPQLNIGLGAITPSSVNTAGTVTAAEFIKSTFTGTQSVMLGSSTGVLQASLSPSNGIQASVSAGSFFIAGTQNFDTTGSVNWHDVGVNSYSSTPAMLYSSNTKNIVQGTVTAGANIVVGAVTGTTAPDMIISLSATPSVTSVTASGNIGAATLSSTGIATLNSASVTADITAATIHSSGASTLNSAVVTNNMGAATISTSGLATLASASVTADIAAATVHPGNMGSAIGLVGKNALKLLVPITSVVANNGVTFDSTTTSGTITIGQSAATPVSVTASGNVGAATLSSSGAATLNSAVVTNNMGAATISSSGAATLNSAVVTNNMGAATISSSGLATLNSASVTNDIAAATVHPGNMAAAIGLVGQNAAKLLVPITSIVANNGITLDASTTAGTITIGQSAATPASVSTTGTVTVGSLTAAVGLVGSTVGKALQTIGFAAASNGALASMSGNNLQVTNQQDISSTASPTFATLSATHIQDTDLIVAGLVASTVTTGQLLHVTLPAAVTANGVSLAFATPDLSAAMPTTTTLTVASLTSTGVIGGASSSINTGGSLTAGSMTNTIYGGVASILLSSTSKALVEGTITPNNGITAGVSGTVLTLGLANPSVVTLATSGLATLNSASITTTLGVTGAITGSSTISGTTITGSTVASTGGITAATTIAATGALSGASVAVTGAATAATVTASGTIAANSFVMYDTGNPTLSTLTFGCSAVGTTVTAATGAPFTTGNTMSNIVLFITGGISTSAVVASTTTLTMGNSQPFTSTTCAIAYTSTIVSGNPLAAITPFGNLYLATNTNGGTTGSSFMHAEMLAEGSAGNSIQMDVSTTPGNGLPTSSIKFINDGTKSSHVAFLSKIPGAYANNQQENMRVLSSGGISVPGGYNQGTQQYTSTGCSQSGTTISDANSGFPTSGSGSATVFFQNGIAVSATLSTSSSMSVATPLSATVTGPVTCTVVYGWAAGSVAITPTGKIFMKAGNGTGVANTFMRVQGANTESTTSSLDMDFQTYTTVQNPSGRFRVLDDNNFGNHFVFYSKAPGTDAGAMQENVRFPSTGGITIQSTTITGAAPTPLGYHEYFTYTTTFTGYVSSPIVTIQLQRTGTFVYCHVDLVTGTITGTAATLVSVTAMPARFFPIVTIFVPIGVLISNALAAGGGASFSTTGIINIGKTYANPPGAFVANGTNTGASQFATLWSVL
jgi:hypothetical protein